MFYRIRVIHREDSLVASCEGATSSAAGPNRCGSANREVIAIVASIALFVILAAQLIPRTPTTDIQSTRPPLVVYCAASNKSVLEAIRRDYEQEFDTALQIQYGPSQTLLASLEVSGSGDLYLPADDSYLGMARDRDLVAEEFELAQMQAVVAVAQGNPRRIDKFADLLRPKLRLSQANVEATAIGKLTHEALVASGQWKSLHSHTTVYKTTVNEVASDVKVGAVDAGIVWDAVLHDYPALVGIAIPELAAVRANIGVAVLKSSTQPRPLSNAREYTCRGCTMAAVSWWRK
jgi:molybdate transport system substrate-binding protein